MKRRVKDNRKRYLWVAALVLLVTGIALPISAQAAYYSLNPLADAFVSGRSGYEDTNYGGGIQLYVGHFATYGGFNQQSFLKFDLSSIGAGETVTSAILHLKQNSGGTANTVLFLHYVSDDTWTETGITWNNQPSTGKNLDYLTYNSTDWVTWDLLKLNGGWTSTEDLKASDQTLSLAILGNRPTVSNYISFLSNDVSSPTSRPYLEITTSPAPVPVPAAIWLLGSGLMGLLGLRRKLNK